MLSNNNERLNIILSLADKFNYAVFKEACVAKSIEVMCKYEYAQKAGMLMCAINDYPESSPADAYKKFIAENPFTPIIQSVTSSNDFAVTTIKNEATTGCGSCGGGKVR